jgi:putative membrane protein
MVGLLADTDPWRWQPHLEVWFLVAAVVAMGVYAVRVIGPKVVPAGQPVVSGRQKVSFLAAVLVLWVSSDWPLHDIAENNLYAAHMVQHFLLTLIMAPLFLLATPQWLGRLLLDGGGKVAAAVRQLCRPVPAMVLFNAFVFVSHAPFWVNLSVESGAFHYLAHLVIVLTALVVWMPVCGPLPEMRSTLPSQMIYLFVLSILPTVPAAWLVLSEGAIYSAYDHGNQLWGLSPVEDQTVAGLFMQLASGLYLWTIIVVLFFVWANRHEAADRNARTVEERELLTWDEVEREFERLGPPPPE